MTYVPIVTPVVTDQQPSRRTRELADLLGRVVQEYEKAHPSVTGPEVRQALELARSASTKATGAPAAFVVALALGVVMAMGLVGFLYVQGGASLRGGMGMIFAVVALLGAGAVAWAARRAP